MPVHQLFAPASIPDQAHDHSYMDMLMEDDFLQREGLTAVTPEHTANIEMLTRSQTSSTMWFEECCKKLTTGKFARAQTERTSMH